MESAIMNYVIDVAGLSSVKRNDRKNVFKKKKSFLF
jgi:hypothetical protein